MAVSPVEEIKERYQVLLRRVESAATRVGRDPSSVRIVAVSKSQPNEKIMAAWEAGIRDFGENRAQEFIKKQNDIDLDITWHFVGHLQTNKVKMITGKALLIHSIDSERLAAEVNKHAKARGVQQDILLQVNESGETSKFGFTEKELEEALPNISALNNIKVRGLMTIAPLTDDDDEKRACFRRLAQLRHRLQEEYRDLDLNILSMGMTDDFEIAVEEGANLLRIGTAIFGPRFAGEETG